MLKIEKLNVYYGESHILRDVSMHIPPGKVVCLMGRNGVGKTTTLKTVMGLLSSRSGSVVFDGKDITKMPTYKRARAGIGYVPQGREIIPQLTVEENLIVGLEAAQTRSRKIPDDVYETFPVLYEMLKRRGGDLSGGQQQQLAIARVLVARPKLLILDEPTEGIQPNIIQDIENVIRKLSKTMSILMVEQYLEFAWSLADNYYIMSRGSIIANGETKDLSHSEVQEHLTV